MVKNKFLEILSLFFIATYFSVGGVVEGKVILKGVPPSDVIIPSAKTKDCHDGEIKTEFWKVATNGGLAEVVVWIEGVDKKAKPTHASEVLTINQQGCRYVPHVSAVRVKEKVKIKNSDATLHNARGSQFVKNRKGRIIFNLAQPSQGMVSEVFFPETGLYSLECDVHPWMQAWVMALESPFFAVTDSEGYFRLPFGVPPGEYEIKAWHSRFLDPLSQKIKVTDQTNEVKFEFMLKAATVQ